MAIRGWYEDEAPNNEFVAVLELPVGTLGLVKVDDERAKLEFQNRRSGSERDGVGNLQRPIRCQTLLQLAHAELDSR